MSEVTRDAFERYLEANGRLSFAGPGRSGRSA